MHCCSLIQFHSPSIYLKTCSAGKSTWNWTAERLGAEVSCIRLYLTEKMTIENKIIFQKKCGWLHQIWRDSAANGFHKEKQSSAFLSFCCSVRELSKLSTRPRTVYVVQLQFVLYRGLDYLSAFFRQLVFIWGENGYLLREKDGVCVNQPSHLDHVRCMCILSHESYILLSRLED